MFNLWNNNNMYAMTYLQNYDNLLIQSILVVSRRARIVFSSYRE